MTIKITIAVDYSSLVYKSKYPFHEEAIDKFIGQCAERGVDELQWRVSFGGALLYYSKTADRYQKNTANVKVINEHPDKIKLFEKLNTVMSRFDPLEVACKSARKHGLRIVPWLTLFDDYGRFGDSLNSFLRSNPEKSWTHFDGKEHFPGFPSYVWNETVEFRLTQIRELLSYDVDGIYLSNRSHSRPPEYSRKAKDFLAKNPDGNIGIFNRTFPNALADSMNPLIHQFGFDKLAVDEYSKQFGRQASHDDMNWWHFRGKYFESFLKKVRHEVDKKGGSLGFGLRFTERDEEHMRSFNAIRIFPEGFFDWESYLTNGIIDEAHYKVDSKQKFSDLYPELNSTALRQRMGWFWLGTRSFDERRDIGLRVLKAVEDNSIGGVVLFEAHSLALTNPKHWDWIKIFRGNQA